MNTGGFTEDIGLTGLSRAQTWFFWEPRLAFTARRVHASAYDWCRIIDVYLFFRGHWAGLLAVLKRLT